MVGSLILVACRVHAQRAIVLDFKGDPQGKLRGQVERVIHRENKLPLSSLTDYKQVALQKNLSPSQSMSSTGFAQLSGLLKLEVALLGVVKSGTLSVEIVSASGDPLWAKELPLRHGLMAPLVARKLASALAAAAGTESGPVDAPVTELKEAAPLAPPLPTQVPEVSEVVKPPVPPPVGASENAAPDSVAPPAPVPAPPATSPPAQRLVEAPLPTPIETADQRASRLTALMDPTAGEEVYPPSRPTPRREALQLTRKPVSPHIIEFELDVVGSFRHFCARPGVSSFQAYDNLVVAGMVPSGGTVDFSTSSPYFGGQIGGSLFPFAPFNSALRGIGAVARYQRASVQSQTSLTGPGGSASVPQKTQAKAESWMAAGAFRLFFNSVGFDVTQGYFGIRLGYQNRSFSSDASATKRTFPLVGLDVSIPLGTAFRLEGSGSYFFNPKVTEAQTGPYGNSTHAFGVGFEVGPAGTLVGPLGYVIRFRYEMFHDSYSGQGSDWPSGGTSEESYSEIYGGLTLGF